LAPEKFKLRPRRLVRIEPVLRSPGWPAFAFAGHDIFFACRTDRPKLIFLPDNSLRTGNLILRIPANIRHRPARGQRVRATHSCQRKLGHQDRLSPAG
jgi:hypothetical protein